LGHGFGSRVGLKVEVGKGEAARGLRFGFGFGFGSGRSLVDALALDVLLDGLVSLRAVGWEIRFALGVAELPLAKLTALKPDGFLGLSGSLKGAPKLRWGSGRTQEFDLALG
jgi:hypothetical protein